MATANVTRKALPANQVGVYYEVLRERMNQAAALADALSEYQQEGTHAFHLAQLLAYMMSEAKCWAELDAFFGVDAQGNPIGEQHG